MKAWLDEENNLRIEAEDGWESISLRIWFEKYMESFDECAKDAAPSEAA